MNMGLKVYLTNKEEKEVVDFLLNCAKWAMQKQDKMFEDGA